MEMEMSWYSPENWGEVARNVERAATFNSTRLHVRGASAHQPRGHLATRAVLSGHLDDFARRIIESNDELHARYTATNRRAAEQPDDVTYFVCRDGNALVYLTRSADIVVNPALDQTTLRYRNAMARIMPPLERLAEYAKRIRLFEEGRDELRA